MLTRTLLMSLAVILALAAPSHAQDAKPSTAPAAPPEQVRLGYFANVTHAQAVLGVDSGDFAKAVAPSKFSTKVFNAGPSLIEALFAGEIDIGYVGPSPALSAHVQSRGLGVRVIAGAAANGVVIVASTKSGIKTLEDLKGKRIATPQLGNTQDVSAKHFLKEKFGDAAMQQVIPIPNAEQAAMMARGEIDAAWAVEPWGARLIAEAGAVPIAEEKDLWPSKKFTLTLIITTPEFLAKHPETVEKILATHCAWTKKLAEKPNEQVAPLAAAIAKLTSRKLGEDVIRKAIARVTFTDEPLTDSLRTFAQWAFDLRLAKTLAKVDTLVETSILDKVKAQSEPAPANLPAAPQAPATDAPKKP